MLNLIKVEVPATQEQDLTLENDVWFDGKLMVSRGEYHDTYFLQHETREVIEITLNKKREEVYKTRQAVFAFPITVDKPATYEKVVNAAERVAYNLRSDSEAISFTASLARRYRLNPQDAETIEHDSFMNSVMKEVKPLFH